jgi:4-diphosphocytidyl-2C-methyl-D-erythritol kinase
VPFFLGAPLAIASGRGTDLEPLSPIMGDVILLVPDVTLEAKTRSMYGALQTEDFGDGTVADRASEAIGVGRIPSSGDMQNSFSRAAAESVPMLQSIWTTLGQANVGAFALTGAGPATFVLLDRGRDRSEVARSLHATMPSGVRVIETEFRVDPLTARLEQLG